MPQPKRIIIPKSEKTIREERIKERKSNLKTNPSNKDIMEMLNDIADRQSEIYDMLKK